MRLRERPSAWIRGGRFPGGGGASRGTERRSRGGRQRGPGHVPARLRAHHHSLSGAGGRDGADRASRGARALRRRSRSGAGFHRVARRPFGQAAGRARRRAEDGGQLAGTLAQPGGAPLGRALRGSGGRSAAVPADRHHGRSGAAPFSARPEADLDEGGQPRLGLGPLGPRRATRGARGRPALEGREGREGHDPADPAADRDVQHQQRQSPLAEPPRLARPGKAGRRLPAGTQGRHERVPSKSDRGGRLRRGLVRAALLERRGHPRARRRACADPHHTPRRRRRHAGPLRRSRRARGARRPRSTCPTATRSPDPNSRTSSPGSSASSGTPPR